MSKLSEMWETFKALFEEQLGGQAPPVEAKERAVDMYQMETMAYRKMEEMMPQMSYRGMWIDNDGEMFCLSSWDNKLYRHPISLDNGDMVMGEMQEVTQEFVPKMRTTITRQADGRVRWLSISATAVLNRSGEIDSRELFDNFVKRAEETGRYPERIFYHQDGQKFVVGQADFLARSDNCYVTSGLYNDSFLAQAEIKAREANPDGWGDSIGYYPMGEPDFIKIRNFDIPVYRDGENIEISTLPTNEAASLFVRTEVKRQMNERQLQALAALAFSGDTEAAQKWIEENPDEVNRQIDQNGLITRATGETEKTEEVELTEELVTVIVQRMAENEVVKTLRETVEAQAATIQTLQGELEQLKVDNANFDVRLQPLERSKTEIERQARLDLPAAATIKVGFKPSEQRGAQQEVNSKQVAESTLDSIGLKY